MVLMGCQWRGLPVPIRDRFQVTKSDRWFRADFGSGHSRISAAFIRRNRGAHQARIMKISQVT